MVLYNLYYPDNLQKEKFSIILDKLKDNNQYYKKILEKFEELSFDKTYSLFPYSTKEEIKKNFDLYVTHSEEERLIEWTSGTTGRPLRCLKTKSERSFAALCQLKERQKWDKDFNNDLFINLLQNNIHFEIGDFCNLEKNHIAECFQKLLDYGPRWICGPVSVVERLARLIESKHIPYTNNQIKFIELQGEFVEDKKRKYIEQVLGCKTIVHYGNKECWCIAYECYKHRLHIMNNVFLEIDKFPDKSYGEIVLTSLYNTLMPIIKYKTGDIGEIIYSVECECGNKSPVLNLLGGRTTSLLKIGDKEFIGDIFFKRVIWLAIRKGQKYHDFHNDVIDGFKVEQRSSEHIVMFIQKGIKYTESVTENIINIIIDKIGTDKIMLEIKFVNEISLSKSGKSIIFESFIS